MNRNCITFRKYKQKGVHNCLPWRSESEGKNEETYDGNHGNLTPDDNDAKRITTTQWSNRRRKRSGSSRTNV